MTTSDTYHYFLMDLVSSIVDLSDKARAKAKSDFDMGRAFAFGEVLSRIYNAAESFDIEPGEFGLSKAMADKALGIRNEEED